MYLVKVDKTKGGVMVNSYSNRQWDVIQYGSFPSVNPSVFGHTESSLKVRNDESPLCEACSQGKMDIVIQLIDEGFDINQRDLKNQTPVINAAENGHRSIVEYLVKRGAKISYALLCTVKSKIDLLEENARAGKEDPYSVVKWKNFLDYLIVEGKKQ
ncbi:MAG: ankyrin repeat domain-containing protein [Bacteroidales bacterium]